MTISEKKVRAVQRAVVRWFQTHQRDLPWRKTRDPYRILISEVMLQQTQVDRVVPKYRAFLRRFPAIHLLARASPREVILAWAGMGYNRRALYILRMAQQVEREFGGRVPTQIEDLRTLPGVGPYTAAAVATFATGIPHALADTNVQRVIGRVFLGRTLQSARGQGGKRSDGPARARRLLHSQAAEERQLLRVVERTMPRQRVAGMAPALWGHALMDLGALVCRAKPKCEVCPVQKWCAAYPFFWEMRNENRAVMNRRRISRSSFLVSHIPDRITRGHILQVVRERDPEPVSLADLRPRIDRLSFSDLHRLVRGLVREGLLARSPQQAVRLPR